MTITLTHEESEKYFYNSLCNGSYFASYGIVLDYTDKAYNKAAKSLKKKFDASDYPKETFIIKGQKPTICREDIWMEILRNGDELKVVVEEYEGEYDRAITLKDVHERVQKTPLDHLNDAIKENDDAVTADVILQTVFYQELVFG